MTPLPNGRRITLTVATQEEFTAMLHCLEAGRDVVREECSDGSGLASREQDAVEIWLDQLRSVWLGR